MLGQSAITFESIRAQGISEITNINLGLYEREMPDLAVVQDIENVKVGLNGYEHIYEYAKRYQFLASEIKNPNFNLGVSFGLKYGPQSYAREMYESDLVYNGQNPGALKVTLTYKMVIRNETTNLWTKANEVVNYYDSRYENVKVTDVNGKELDCTVGKQNDQYNKLIIKTDENIAPQTNYEFYMTYTLSNDAVNSVLNGEQTLNSISEITSYSTFTDKGQANKYAAVDRDSNPGSAVIDNTNTYEDDTDKAPSMIMTPKEARVIKGTVWEDKAITEGAGKERVGDGKYNASGENVVQNAKVDLLEIGVDGSGNTIYPVAKLYKKSNMAEGIPATTTTNNKGEYEFSGVIPGNYLVRYTYGNQSVIYDINGNKVEDVKITNYKSTIYRGGNANETEDKYWYAKEMGNTATRLSDAKDEIGIYQDNSTVNIIEDRTTEKEINYGTVQKDETLDRIEANTKPFEIKLEYDVNADNISEYGIELKFIFDNIDFGIIRRPKQIVDIQKEISNIEVTLANGQVIISGDPRSGNISYVKMLPDGNVDVEIDSELIQGATLKLQYAVTAVNNSELDYNDKDYYIYGTSKNNLVTANITSMFDYLDNGLVYDNENQVNIDNGWEKVTIDHSLVDNGYLSEEAYNVAKKYNMVFKTDKFNGMGVGETRTVYMEVSKLLANNEDDFTYDNEVEVNTLTGRKIDNATPGNYVPGNDIPVEEKNHEPDDSDVFITITGPTGENNNYLPYITLGVSALVILGAGVIL